MNASRNPTVTSKIMSSIRSKDTKAELLLGKEMWHLGLRYRKQYSIYGRPDFAFIKKKIAVFCDGDFWHGRDFEEKLAKGRFKNNVDYWANKITKNRERDVRVNQELLKNGWLVIRIWESEILEDSKKQALLVYEKYQKIKW